MTTCRRIPRSVLATVRSRCARATARRPRQVRSARQYVDERRRA